MRRVSAKRRARQAAYDAAREQRAHETRGRCELQVAHDCRSRGDQAHHVQPRSRGGSDDVENLRWCCGPCHTWVHHHPTAATERGWLRSWSPTPPLLTDLPDEPIPSEPYRCSRCEAPMDAVARIISEQSPYPGACPHCAATLTAAQDEVNRAARDQRPDPF
jgi:DNA-directed RNA polymerase subunit RPC12/RpoP